MTELLKFNTIVTIFFHFREVLLKPIVLLIGKTSIPSKSVHGRGRQSTYQAREPRNKRVQCSKNAQPSAR